MKARIGYKIVETTVRGAMGKITYVKLEAIRSSKQGRPLRSARLVNLHLLGTRPEAL